MSMSTSMNNIFEDYEKIELLYMLKEMQYVC